MTEKFQEEEAFWGSRIDALSTENSRLKERLDGQSNTDALRRLGPILQPFGCPSVAWEMVELFFGKKNTSVGAGAPPSSLLSVSDIQKCVLQFCTQFLTNSCPLTWRVHRGVRNEGGREIVSGEEAWTLTGNMGGIRGAELKVMNFEAMVSIQDHIFSWSSFSNASFSCFLQFSKYLVQQLGDIRPARERLRRILWSVLVWLQSQYRSGGVSGGLSTRFESVVDSLPRSIMEHEKSILQALSILFGLSHKSPGREVQDFHSGMITAGSQVVSTGSTSQSQQVEDKESRGSSATNSITILREPVSGIDDVFLNIFMRCFSSMQVRRIDGSPGVVSRVSVYGSGSSDTARKLAGWHLLTPPISS